VTDGKTVHATSYALGYPKWDSWCARDAGHPTADDLAPRSATDPTVEQYRPVDRLHQYGAVTVWWS